MLALDAVGVPLPLSTVVISVLAYAATGLLLFAWIARYRRPLVALVLAGLIVANPPFAVLASLSTPDALALGLIAGAAFAFAELRRPAVMITCWRWPCSPARTPRCRDPAAGCRRRGGRREPRVRLHPLVALGAAVLVGGLVLGVSRLVGGYSHTLLFWHTFFGLLGYPARGAPPLALSDVLHLYAYLAGKLTTTVLPLFGLLGVVALGLRVRSLAEVRRDPASLLVVASLAAAVAGWLAFPYGPERMLVGSFLVVAAVLGASTSRGETAVVGAPETVDIEPSPTASPVVAAST